MGAVGVDGWLMLFAKSVISLNTGVISISCDG
jgi:hypothetical protein